MWKLFEFAVKLFGFNENFQEVKMGFKRKLSGMNVYVSKEQENLSNPRTGE